MKTRAIIAYRREPLEKSCMEELKALAEAAGYEVVGSVEQVKSTPHPRYHIGAGKAKELAQMVKDLNAEKVIFGNELKIVQIYNLAKLTGVEVIDRLQLILEIFVRRASTREAKLQIELAKLRYEMANAREKVKLAKMGEQPGFHGLGKYEADVYYEAIKRRVNKIQEKLKEIRRTRNIHRTRRSEMGFPSISLAGYTNSGKSTLFNALTKESVPVDSGVFTTLSTTTRLSEILGEKVFITDTVGFIDRLPITLIEAFHSTLEETIFSDLILLVVDVSEPISEILRKLIASLETIREIGVLETPIIVALNKIDLISSEELQEKIEKLKGTFNLTFIPISALYGINLDLLKGEIVKILGKYVAISSILPISQNSLSFLSRIFENMNVHKIEYSDNSIQIQFSAPVSLIDKIKSQVERVGGKFELL
ncbi:GTPase HflX [Candidatus Bathyarchaeota archaeon]|nr:GTPase HflX [Candidatus Bathyarchaeota archaeon]